MSIIASTSAIIFTIATTVTITMVITAIAGCTGFITTDETSIFSAGIWPTSGSVLPPRDVRASPTLLRWMASLQ
eukprot:1645108-Alexandrium_andersonii.AAC.1